MVNVTVEKVKNERVFVPKMSNFETSSRYEGLTFKKENLSKSLDDLKIKYAR